jgi:hypothetical protein
MIHAFFTCLGITVFGMWLFGIPFDRRDEDED